jgi:hypothetical protein
MAQHALSRFWAGGFSGGYVRSGERQHGWKTAEWWSLGLSVQVANPSKISYFSRMKYIYTFVILLLTIPLLAQTSVSVDKQIRDHFSEFKPEAYAYYGLTSYGRNKNTAFTDYQIKEELRLYSEVIKSGLIDNPTNDVFALCHNILIHSPEKGKEFLSLLNKPTTSRNITDNLFSDFIFTEEFGEQLALANLNSADENWRLLWSRYLKAYAMYDSSIPTIQAEISKQTNTEVQRNLINALMNIGNPTCFSFVKKIIDTTSNDSIMSVAIFAYAEFTGYAGISEMKTIKTVGPASTQELKWSIDWFKKNASPKNNYGDDVKNDIEFIERYGDIQSQGMIWLEKHGYLDTKKAENPKPLSAEDKKIIFEYLLQTNGFELDAIKGDLFLSLEQSDMPTLLKLRSLAYYSPNAFTKKRIKTLGIMIRRLKRTR